MTRPISIQANAVSWVRLSSDTIIPLQIRIPRIGTRGTMGVRNGRAREGSERRMIITPMQTRTKANSVPMDVRSPAREPGINPANRPDKNKQNHIASCKACGNAGVPRRRAWEADHRSPSKRKPGSGP